MKTQFSSSREKNMNHFSSRISRDRDSCQCLRSSVGGRTGSDEGRVRLTFVAKSDEFIFCKNNNSMLDKAEGDEGRAMLPLAILVIFVASCHCNALFVILFAMPTFVASSSSIDRNHTKVFSVFCSPFRTFLSIFLNFSILRSNSLAGAILPLPMFCIRLLVNDVLVIANSD